MSGTGDDLLPRGGLWTIRTGQREASSATTFWSVLLRRGVLRRSDESPFAPPGAQVFVKVLSSRELRSPDCPGSVTGVQFCSPMEIPVRERRTYAEPRSARTAAHGRREKGGGRGGEEGAPRPATERLWIHRHSLPHGRDSGPCTRPGPYATGLAHWNRYRQAPRNCHLGDKLVARLFGVKALTA